MIAVIGALCRSRSCVYIWRKCFLLYSSSTFSDLLFLISFVWNGVCMFFMNFLLTFLRILLSKLYICCVHTGITREHGSSAGKWAYYWACLQCHRRSLRKSVIFIVSAVNDLGRVSLLATATVICLTLSYTRSIVILVFDFLTLPVLGNWYVVGTAPQSLKYVRLSHLVSSVYETCWIWPTTFDLKTQAFLWCHQCSVATRYYKYYRRQLHCHIWDIQHRMMLCP